MKYFTKEFLDFFKELDKNNNKAWFDKNRKRYEEHVKVPFKNFTELMIMRVKEHEPDLQMEAKDAMFRINRDIRFSKDKRPYNPRVSANIQKGGKKAIGHPGFYFQFSYNNAMTGGGAYHLDKDTLYSIRSTIVSSMKEFNKLVEDKKFKQKFGEIKGDKNKKLPKEFQEAFEKQPLVANKQFYYMVDLKPNVVLKPDLPDLLMDHYKAGAKLNKYLDGALQKK
jgi:uncharacterized protein (TIGR02453 family)